MEEVLRKHARLQFLYKKLITALREGKNILFSKDGKTWKIGKKED